MLFLLGLSFGTGLGNTQSSTRMITNEKSICPIITFDLKHYWGALLELVKPELDKRGLDRLKTILEKTCKCVAIEYHYIDKDYRDTFSHFHSKRFNTPSSRCVRLHFFSESITEQQIINGGEALQSIYQGYSVIRPTKPNCIGRTLLSHELRLHSRAHIRTCKEAIFLLGTRLEVEGFPFISQDADATVCAESSLWMVMRYYSNRYHWYGEILPFQITNLATKHATGSRIFPSSGLYSWQLAEALRLQKFSPVIYSRKQFPHFDHLLYTYIESGLPLLLTLPKHAVAAYGHVSDYDAQPPTPHTKYVYSSHFNRGFVISDDNCFPYQMLWGPNRPGTANDSPSNSDQIEEFIVPLPEKVFLTAEQVQPAIEAVLSSEEVGIPAMSSSLDARIKANKTIILRLFLTSARSFKSSLKDRGMGNANLESVYRNLPMPHFIWICEIADYEEYTTSRKILGEILWDATRNAKEPDGWMALHFPEKLIYDSGSAFNGRQELKTLDLGAGNSYFPFQSNLHTL